LLCRFSVLEGEEKGNWEVGRNTHAIGRVAKGGVVVVGDEGECWGWGVGRDKGGGRKIERDRNEEAPKINVESSSGSSSNSNTAYKKRRREEEEGEEGEEGGKKGGWEGDVKLDNWREFAKAELGVVR